MRSADGFAVKIAKWELLAAGIEPLLGEMPYLQPFHDQLQGLIARAMELDQRQEAARAELRELTRERQGVEREGETLRARAAAHLRAAYGFASEELVRFGITPRPAGPRRQDPDQPEPAQPDAG
jgi:hypothetical protein